MVACNSVLESQRVRFEKCDFCVTCPMNDKHVKLHRLCFTKSQQGTQLIWSYFYCFFMMVACNSILKSQRVRFEKFVTVCMLVNNTIFKLATSNIWIRIPCRSIILRPEALTNVKLFPKSRQETQLIWCYFYCFFYYGCMQFYFIITECGVWEV